MWQDPRVAPGLGSDASAAPSQNVSRGALHWVIYASLVFSSHAQPPPQLANSSPCSKDSSRGCNVIYFISQHMRWIVKTSKFLLWPKDPHRLPHMLVVIGPPYTLQVWSLVQDQPPLQYPGGTGQVCLVFSKVTLGSMHQHALTLQPWVAFNPPRGGLGSFTLFSPRLHLKKKIGAESIVHNRMILKLISKLNFQPQIYIVVRVKKCTIFFLVFSKI